MITPVQSVIDDALRLPETDREEVIVRLLASFDPLDEQGVEESWAQEIQIRIDEIRSGKVKPIPWEEARRLIMAEQDGDDDD